VTLNTFKYYLPAFFWICTLFFLSSLESDSIPSFGFQFNDLVAHFCVYTVLGYLLSIAFLRGEKALSRIALVLLLGWLYGMSDEVHQLFVPGRFATITDWGADAVGTAFGLLIFLKVPGLFLWIDRKVFN